MLGIIGFMIAAFIITYMFEVLTSEKGRGFIGILAVISIVICVYGCYELLTISSNVRDSLGKLH